MGTIKVHISTYEGNMAWTFPMKDSELESKLGAVGLGGIGEIPIASVIYPEELCVLNGLRVNADELNFLAKSIMRYDESEYDRFIAAAGELKSPDVRDLINLSFNLQHYTLIKDVADLAGIGRDHLLNIRGYLTKTELETIDFAKVGRDLLASGRGIPTGHGLLFENEEVPFQQVYDGTTFPPYVYSANVVAIVNLHYGGKTEYLYLPEEDISIKKALKRLGALCLSDCSMELEVLACSDENWQDRLETNFEIAGLHEANYLAEVLSRNDLDFNKLLRVTDYAEVVAGEEIQKLADHLDDFIVIKGAENYADVGEYVTRHELGYEVGENMPDFVNYPKLGEYIMQERDGEFMGGCFVCMEAGCDYTQVMGDNHQEIEFGGM